jgi:hypothetical protein
MLNDALFVSDKIHEKQVKLPDGSEHTLYFKELPAVDFRKLHDADDSDAMARLVVLSLCEPDGKPAITIKDANRLKPSVFSGIVTALMEVNGFGAKNA